MLILDGWVLSLHIDPNCPMKADNEHTENAKSGQICWEMTTAEYFSSVPFK